jgi:salicylate hydroxylase
VQPKDFVIRSYKDGKVLSKQNLVPYTENHYKAPYLHIHRADFHNVLVNAARELGVEIRLKSSVQKVDFDKPSVTLKDGSEFKADIILGADGLRSVCREEMLGHADPPHLTGDLAYRMIVRADDMRKHKDLVELTENPAINFWLGPDAHAVCYLLKG